MKHIALYLLAGIVLAVSGYRASGALSRRNQARESLAMLRVQATELKQLRSSAQESKLPLKPEGGLAGRVSQALSRAGLSSSAMQSLSPESESSDQGVLRQRATLTLSGVTLPQLGKFLDAWRSSEPTWTMSSLDVGPSGVGTPGADLPLRSVISLEALYRDRPRPGFVGGPR